MAIRIDTNEVFDQDGNLLFSEQVEIEIADNPMSEVVANLTEEQRTALLAALQSQ